MFHFNLEHVLEIPATIAGLLNIYLAARGNIWNWFFGLLTVTIYGVVFYQAKLYGDMFLQILYFFFQIYGWYEWRYRNDGAVSLNITHMKKSLYGVVVGLTIGLTALFIFLLSHDTNSTTPVVDGFTTAVSLVAQWMMCQKWIETWWLWMLVDVVSIYMYAYKHLYLTSGLYLVFFGICWLGYMGWNRLKAALPEHTTNQSAN